ncbi:MAG TPA: hypothetical protein VGL04_03505, partial [Sporichthyaceae bacterium]
MSTGRGRVAITLALASGIAGLTAPAFAQTWAGVQQLTAQVAALTPTAGEVRLSWTGPAATAVTVSERTGDRLTELGTTADLAWSSDHFPVGPHVFRVTPVGSTDWSEITIAVPTQQLLGEQNMALATAAPPTTSASGVLRTSSYFASPAVSPDRHTIAAAGYGETGTGPYGIWLLTNAGTPLRRVSGPPTGYDSEPAFSPDGRRLAFTHYEEPTAGRAYYTSIWIVDLTVPGAEPTPVANSADLMDPAWTPDAGTLVLGSAEWTSINNQTVQSNPLGLVTLRLDGSGPIPIPNTLSGHEP